ncbi:MAG TPA: YbhB/YbcL family Raf kinase inhibitor-like protein [Methanobacterium sp.]
MAIKLTSEVFNEGETIPDRYACRGVNVSPPLEWEHVEGTIKYTIICEDPDASSVAWTHWIIFNIPNDTTNLSEWIMEREEINDGTKQGFNDFGTIGYRGPCPPGGTHKYNFKVYALDTVIQLPAKITKEDLLKAMEGHILDEGHLMGRYTR